MGDIPSLGALECHAGSPPGHLSPICATLGLGNTTISAQRPTSGSALHPALRRSGGGFLPGQQGPWHGNAGAGSSPLPVPKGANSLFPGDCCSFCHPHRCSKRGRGSRQGGHARPPPQGLAHTMLPSARSAVEVLGQYPAHSHSLWAPRAWFRMPSSPLPSPYLLTGLCASPVPAPAVPGDWALCTLLSPAPPVPGDWALHIPLFPSSAR